MYRRHYFAINPAATAFYIDAYREMWDSEPTTETLGWEIRDTTKSEAVTPC
jgi:hypothetical protein